MFNDDSIRKDLGKTSLQLITSLRQLCNHPHLVNMDTGSGTKALTRDWYLQSGKMSLLVKMLEMIRKSSTDQVILISNFTQTLDLLEKLCKDLRYTFLRLDGKLSIVKRQQLVDKFNSPGSNIFIFMLSSKAGGCGLNLVAANRLILFDPDWNPGKWNGFSSLL
jgi:DNA repair and recombination RAD54-like protein